MNKTVKRFITMIMVAITLLVIAVPVAAQEFVFDDNPQCIWSISIDEGRRYTGFCDRVAEGYKYYSNNDEIMSVEADGTLVAKNDGNVVIAEVFEGELWYYYGFTVNAQPQTISDASDEFINDHREYFNGIIEKQEKAISFAEIFVPILIVLLILLVLAEVVYIFVTAPKFGMSRFWAIAPIIGNVFGLFVFLMLKTLAKQNTMSTANVIVCPVCNGRHPYGTSVCSICGAKLGQ